MDLGSWAILPRRVFIKRIRSWPQRHRDTEMGDGAGVGIGYSLQSLCLFSAYGAVLAHAKSKEKLTVMFSAEVAVVIGGFAIKNGKNGSKTGLFLRELTRIKHELRGRVRGF